MLAAPCVLVKLLACHAHHVGCVLACDTSLRHGCLWGWLLGTGPACGRVRQVAILLEACRMLPAGLAVVTVSWCR